MPPRRTTRRVLPAVAAGAVLLITGLALTLTTRGGMGNGGNGGLMPPGRRSAPSAGTSARTAPQLPQPGLAGLRWRDFHGVQLPFSPQAGPYSTSAGLASGFSHTPLGALLAALNIAVRANAQWGPAIFGPEIQNQVTGPDTAALLASCQSAYSQASQAAHITGGQPLGNAYVTEEAFRWVSYTPASATVDLVSAGPGSQGVTVRAVTRVGVVWNGGDWRVIAPPGGDWGREAARLPSLQGYTIFPGQG